MFKVPSLCCPPLLSSMLSLSIFYSPLYIPPFRIVQNSRASSKILFPGEYRPAQHWKIQLFPQFGGQEICHQERAFRFLTGKSPFHVSSNSYPLNMITLFPTSRNSPIITHDPLFFMIFVFPWWHPLYSHRHPDLLSTDRPLMLYNPSPWARITAITDTLYSQWTFHRAFLTQRMFESIVQSLPLQAMHFVTVLHSCALSLEMASRLLTKGHFTIAHRWEQSHFLLQYIGSAKMHSRTAPVLPTSFFQRVSIPFITKPSLLVPL